MSSKILKKTIKKHQNKAFEIVSKLLTMKKPRSFLKGRDYDMPLNKSEDTQFLILLITLMSFLSVLAGSGTFALNAMAERWSSGLENKITIEIPVETQKGQLLSTDTVKKETLKIAKFLKQQNTIKTLTVMSTEEIQNLVSPWIGTTVLLDDIPLPGLIAIELHNSSPKILNNLKTNLKEISPYANLETHHEWLSDLINFTSSLKTLALFITIIIITITLIATISGVRTRLAIHTKEVKLLHSMGASDLYIARQFQRHAMIIGLKGGICGTALGLLITYTVFSISSHAQTSLIPDIKVTTQAFLILCCIPIMMTALSAITARITVLRSLLKMP